MRAGLFVPGGFRLADVSDGGMRRRRTWNGYEVASGEGPPAPPHQPPGGDDPDAPPPIEEPPAPIPVPPDPGPPPMQLQALHG